MGSKFGPRVMQLESTYAIGAHAATVYGKSVDLSHKSNFAVIFLAVGTTQNILIQFEQSRQAPTTENAADATYWSVPSGATDIAANLTDANLLQKELTPVTLQFGRFKYTTGAGNTATTMDSWLSFTEEWG